MKLRPFVKAIGIAGLAVFSLPGATLAHDSGNFQGWRNGWGQGHMMGPGQMMGQGHMMGQGYMMGPGQMMGQGHMMGPGQMMDQGHMMGQGYMMGPGFNGRGNFNPGMMQPLREDLSADDVRHMMSHRLSWMNNPNIKLGSVEEKDADTIIADIVSQDGSLVQRLRVDRHTGWMEPSQ